MRLGVSGLRREWRDWGYGPQAQAVVGPSRDGRRSLASSVARSLPPDRGAYVLDMATHRATAVASLRPLAHDDETNFEEVGGLGWLFGPGQPTGLCAPQLSWASPRDGAAVTPQTLVKSLGALGRQLVMHERQAETRRQEELCRIFGDMAAVAHGGAGHPASEVSHPHLPIASSAIVSIEAPSSNEATEGHKRHHQHILLVPDIVLDACLVVPLVAAGLGKLTDATDEAPARQAGAAGAEDEGRGAAEPTAGRPGGTSGFSTGREQPWCRAGCVVSRPNRELVEAWLAGGKSERAQDHDRKDGDAGGRLEGGLELPAIAPANKTAE